MAVCDSVPGVQFNEVFMLLLPNRSLYALLRTNGTFHFTRSFDGGQSWQVPASAFEGMACAGLVLSSGEIMFTYRGCHREVPATPRPATVRLRKGRLYCARLSADGGQTWCEELEIDGGEAYQVGSYGMGDLIELDDGSVKVVYYTSDKDQAPWLEECRLVRSEWPPRPSFIAPTAGA